MTTDRQRHLLAARRWEWLGEYLRLWCAEPLKADDGSSAEEIAAAEARVGPLPAALREWFELVGARLRDVQDSPATPARLWVDDGHLGVWHENQGAWNIVATPRPDGRWDDDPMCVADEGFDFGPAPLSAALHAMTLSDTLVGATAGGGEGPLGLLGQQVRGGGLEDADRDVLAVFPAFALPSNPFFSDPLRGDITTVLRDEGVQIGWMTSTDEAFARFAAHVDLDPPGGGHVVVLTFTGLADPETVLLLGPRDVPDAGAVGHSAAAWSTIVQQALGDLGHVDSVELRADVIRLTVTTRSPDAVVAVLLSVVPEPLLDAAEVTARPARLAVPRVVHPATRAR